MASDEREPVSYEDAVKMIGNHKRIHTFRSGPGLMLGADWNRTALLKAIKKYGSELAGPMATRMGHGLLLIDDTGPLSKPRRTHETK